MSITQVAFPGEQELRQQIARIKDLPPLPLALRRLIDLIADELSTPAELESLIRHDQALSAKLLRIANSSYYGRRGQVQSLARAVSVLGLNQVQQLCLCALMLEFLSGGSTLHASERAALWKHAFLTARIAMEMARRRPWLSPEDAYLLGLLHDIGRLVQAVHFPEQYRVISELSQSRRVPPWYIEVQFEIGHTTIGQWLAIRWGLPEAFQFVARYHHSPEESPSFAPEVKTIALANILANAAQYPELLDDPLTATYCRDLFIPPDEWNAYRELLDEVRPEADQLWDLLK